MTKRPNIVFILTDQQRIDTIAANGFDHMVTPNIDALVHRGAVFENMYVTAPSCAPSRASLFTGTYPHTNGVFRNDEPWNYCWVTELADAGYRCVNVGKMHTMPIEGAFGFHERHVVENKDRDHPNLPFYLDNWDKAIHARGAYKPSRVTYAKRPDYDDALGAFVWEQDEDLHPDVFVGETACWWIERYPGTEPFFLQVGMPGPHPPYDPTQEYLDMYLDKELPEAILDYDLSTQPPPLQALRQNHLDSGHDAVQHLKNPTKEQLHRQRAHYYANVTMIDTQVGHIVKALEERGVLDETIIIFTSDHGDCLNDHGHSQKWNMYEQSVHVPAVICWPGKIEAGQRFPELVSLFDFGPTILEAAQIDIPNWMEAKSLTDLLFHQKDTPRSRVFAEHSDDAILTGTNFMTMIRQEDWKLVHFVDHEEGQLFDLGADPTEVNNLWDDPDHALVRRELIDQILKWRIDSARKSQGFVRMLAQM
ncbi:MAG: sulfatase-like hydrolase/transferase [Aliishimia sp.]